MASLQEFYRDQDTRNNVKNFLVEFLKGEAVRRVFEDENPKVQGIADAKEVIEKAFDFLEQQFGPKTRKGRDSSPR